jgi:hypothetical protein
MKKRKEFLWTLLILISLVAALHLVRAISGWQFIIGSFEVPIWWSYVAFATLSFLGYNLYEYLQK